MSSRHYINIAVLVFALLMHGMAFGSEWMKGKVVLIETDEPLEQVNVINQTTGDIHFSEPDGSFRIKVNPEDVIEFRKMGFKTESTKIRAGAVPFYHVALEPGSVGLPTVFIKGYSYREDSLQAVKMYNHVLRVQKRDEVDYLNNPFVLLDPRARQIWRFQKMFDYYESEKYIDYVFNEDLIFRISPEFDEDKLKDYMKRYRPSYAQIKSWSPYEYLEYIKRTSQRYLKN